MKHRIDYPIPEFTSGSSEVISSEIISLKNIIKLCEQNAMLMWEMIEDLMAVIDMPDNHPLAEDWAKGITVVQEAKEQLSELMKITNKGDKS